MPAANTEMWKSLIIKILLMILTPLAAQLHVNGGAADLPAIAADIADLVVLGYGLYRVNGMKLVPHNSVAFPLHVIASTDPANPTPLPVVPGAIAQINTTAARIVGALLFAFMVLPIAQTHAQTSTVPAQLSAAEAQLYSALNTIVGFVGGFVQADLNAAIADAQSQTPPNAQATACWKAIAQIPVTTIPTGAGLAYLKQRFLDLQGLYTPLNSNCGSVAPLFLKGYNQFMSLAASQNL